MSEVEIPHAHEVDAFGKRVGVAVAVIGVVLSVVTIASHRQHTAAVVYRTEANDQWAYYQAKKIREYQASVGSTVVTALGGESDKVTASLKELGAQRAKYEHDAVEIQKEAEAKDGETQRSEMRALRLDLGEGFLELGLVLSSLYFLARKKLFPGAGGVAAVLGVALAASSLLI
ncbi:MAG: DUF4337 family protein [Gammaproteobacteria bacterium]